MPDLSQIIQISAAHAGVLMQINAAQPICMSTLGH